MSNGSSRIPGFYRLPVAERRRLLRLHADLSEQDLRTLDDGGIDTATADRVVENAVGVYALPLGVGLNFVINGRDYLVPMAVEMPDIEVGHVVTPTADSELGAKGAGEAGTAGAPACVMNAVNDALAPLGAKLITEMPITPTVVLKALGKV